MHPSVDALMALAAQGASGTLEIIPPEAPLVLFVWSKSRVVPVRVTEFSITEEAFDPSLNPLRAKVSLGLRVLSTDDLGFGHKGGTMFISYLRTREALAGKSGGATLASLGLSNLPLNGGPHERRSRPAADRCRRDSVEPCPLDTSDAPAV